MGAHAVWAQSSVAVQDKGFRAADPGCRLCALIWEAGQSARALSLLFVSSDFLFQACSCKEAAVVATLQRLLELGHSLRRGQGV